MLIYFEKDSYLDSGFWESQLGGQLAPPGPGNIVLLEELFFQAAQLLACEGSAVSADALLGGGGRCGRSSGGGVGWWAVARWGW
jgi:hypothetical protein